MYSSGLVAGTYLVRVYNYETIIPLYQYSNINSAYIKVKFRLKVLYAFLDKSKAFFFKYKDLYGRDASDNLD